MNILQLEIKTGDLLKLTGISKKQLYYWELKGIIISKHIARGNREFKRFSMYDVSIIHKIKKLLDEGYTLKAAMERIRR